MSAIDSGSSGTSIADLQPQDVVAPLQPASGAHLPPATTQIPGQPATQAVALGGVDYNTLINGVMQASQNGGTQFPTRHVPMMGDTRIDPQSQTQYVPGPAAPGPGYIPPGGYYPPQGQGQLPPGAMAMHSGYPMGQPGVVAAETGWFKSLSDWYGDSSLSLLIMVLYFFFQLPIFRQFIHRYMGFLFTGDGSYNIYGYVSTSVLFGLTLHFIMRILG